MLYKLEEKVIDKDDIILLVDEDIDDTVFELVSSILKNDCNKAMKLYYNFINNGMDVSQIIAIIASQIRLLFQVKRLYNSGKSNEEIAKILEFKSPYRVKYLLNDCYYYSEDDLIKYLSKLADIDKNIKSGNGDGKFLLELFIAKKICNFWLHTFFIFDRAFSFSLSVLLFQNNSNNTPNPIRGSSSCDAIDSSIEFLISSILSSLKLEII